MLSAAQGGASHIYEGTRLRRNLKAISSTTSDLVSIDKVSIDIGRELRASIPQLNVHCGIHRNAIREVLGSADTSYLAIEVVLAGDGQEKSTSKEGNVNSLH